MLRAACFPVCLATTAFSRWYAILNSAPSGAKKGARPVLADLDQPASLQRIAGLADIVVHLAPPPNATREVARDARDTRTAGLLAALARGRSLPQRIVYISTSGVYGDCPGRWIDETRSARPTTARACRRLDAERQLRAFGRRGVIVSILRVPGIYAADRLPIERLHKGTPGCARLTMSIPTISMPRTWRC
jgi:nucleoside-diphosphate-sugar epimerase